MTQQALERILDIKQSAIDTECAKRAALDNLDIDYQKARGEIEAAFTRKKNAAAATLASEQAAINLKINKARRVYEAEKRRAENRAAGELQEVSRLRKALSEIEAKLPGGITGYEATELPTKPELFSSGEYDSLLVIMSKPSFLMSARRLVSRDALSPEEAKSRYVAMLKHDLALLDQRESKARKDALAPAALKDFEEEKKRIEAGRSGTTIIIDNSEYVEKIKECDKRFKMERTRIESDFARKAESAAVQDCRDIAKSATEALGCAPDQLQAPYNPPLQVPDELFEYWLVVDVEGQSVAVPHTSSLASPTHYHFVNINEREAVDSAIASLVAVQLRFVPQDSLRVVWLDPVSMGRTLGKLSALARTISMQNDSPITVATNSGDIAESLARLEADMANISLKVASYKSLHDYNQHNADDPIPHTIIVAHDFSSGYYGSRELETMHRLAENSSTLGVQLLFSSDASSSEQSDMVGLTKKILSNCQKVEIEDRRLSTSIGGHDYPLLFLSDSWLTPQFIESRKNNTSLSEKPIFSPRVEVNTESEGLTIPVAQTNDGETISLRFGIEYAHAVLTGAPGAGKSVFLHSVIERVCTLYSPDQLDIWLVDYKKTEFGMYRNSELRFPQVSFLGLDGSADFTNGFINHLYKEFETRQNSVLEADAKDLIGYNKNVAPEKRLTKLLVVIDEFHRQSEHMAENDDAKIKFEQVLRESRAYGIYILLSDQTLVGLSGLSPAARNQIAGRIMMRWTEISEVSEMFGSTGDLSEMTLERGDIVTKVGGRLVKAHGRNISKEQIASSVSGLPASFKKPRSNYICYDANERAEMALTSDSLNGNDKGYPVGTMPDFSKPIFFVSLTRKRRENVFIYATEAKLSAELTSILARGAVVADKDAVVLIGDSEGHLYRHSKDALLMTLDNCSTVEELNSIVEINHFFKQCHKNTFVVMADVEPLLEAMDGLPEDSDERDNQNDESSSNIIQDDVDLRFELAALLGDSTMEPQAEKNVQHSEAPFDSRKAILRLLKNGGIDGMRFCWVSETIPNVKTLFLPYSTYDDDFDSMFSHRFASRCSRGDSMELGMGLRACDIREDEKKMKVVYANRREEIVTFKPFKIK